MSAYVVSKAHILYLVAAAVSRRLADHSNGDLRYWLPPLPGSQEPRIFQVHHGDAEGMARIANVLWLENCKSVGARYPDEDPLSLPGAPSSGISPADVVQHGPPGVDFDPVQVLKACDCYAYQACEHQEWQTSEAFAIITALRSKAWHALPGYDAAEWGPPVSWETWGRLRIIDGGRS